jgi:hypothetical protein
MERTKVWKKQRAEQRKHGHKQGHIFKETKKKSMDDDTRIIF